MMQPSTAPTTVAVMFAYVSWMMIVFVAVSMKSPDVIIEAHLISIIVLGPFLADTQQS
jgi:hypothetical protein